MYVPGSYARIASHRVQKRLESVVPMRTRRDAPAEVVLVGDRPNDPSGRSTKTSREQLAHFRGQPYTAINPIAKRCAGQTIRVARLLTPGARRIKGRGMALLDSQIPEWVKASCYKGSPDNLEVLDQHVLLDAIHRPNRWTTDWALKYVSIVSLELTGWTYWWLQQVKSQTLIFHVPSNWVSAKHEKGAFTGWKISTDDNAPEKGVDLPPDAIVPFWYPSPSDPLGGVSPTQANAHAIMIDGYLLEAQERGFKQGIHPGWAVIVGEQVSKQGRRSRPRLTRVQRRQIRAMISARLRGMSKWDEPVILDGMISDMKKLTQSIQEMDFLNSTKMSRGRVNQGYGVNGVITGDNDGVNYAQAAVADQLFCSTTVNPKLELMGRIMTVLLAPHYDTSGSLVVFIEPARPHDPNMRLLEWKAGMNIGYVDGDEYRSHLLYLPPRLGTGVARVPNTLSPIDLDADPMEEEEDNDNAAETEELVDEVDDVEGTDIEDESGDDQHDEPAGDPPQDPSYDDLDTPDADSGQSPTQKRLRRPRYVSKLYRWRDKQAEFYRAYSDLWLAQHANTETDLAASVREFFTSQERDVLERVRKVYSSTDPIAAEKLVDMCYTASDWDREFRRFVEPPMIHAAATGALLELNAFGDVAAKPKLPPNVSPTIEEHYRAYGQRAVTTQDFFDFSMDIPNVVAVGVRDALNSILNEPYWRQVNKTTRTRLVNQLDSGIKGGETMDQIAGRVKNVFGGDMGMSRATAIARTEVTGALNAGQHESRKYLAKQQIVTGKQWMATEDNRTREMHSEADGQERKVTKLFDLSNGERCQYPGDTRLSAENRTNCRCTAVSTTIFSDSARTVFLPPKQLWAFSRCEVHGALAQ